MDLTVNDCLNTTSFAKAKVVAGRKGLSRPVRSCTVLEWSDTGMFRSPYFKEGDIVITSFYTKRNDINAQCSTIRQLQGLQTAALVLFHVGIVMPNIDKALISLADQLDYPLIVVSSNQDVSYSEMIQNIMESLYLKRFSECRLFDNVFHRFSALPKSKRNITKLLELIGQNIPSHLFLYHSDLTYISEWCHPSFVNTTMKDFLGDTSLDELVVGKSAPISQTVQGRTLYLHFQNIAAHSFPPLFLFFITSSKKMEPLLLRQASEILSIADDVYHLGVKESRHSSLLQNLLSGTFDLEPTNMKNVSDYEKEVGTLFYLRPDGNSDRIRGIQLQRLCKETAAFFDSQKFSSLLDVTEDSLILLLLEELNFAYLEELAFSLQEFLDEKSLSVKLAYVQMSSLILTKETYQSICNCWDFMVRINPLRSVFDVLSVRIAEDCKRIVSDISQKSEYKLKVLAPLDRIKDKDEMIKTLEIFFLDTDGSIPKTAELMFVHANTVKYRIRKARLALGNEYFELRGNHYLYLALAIRRIIKDTNI